MSFLSLFNILHRIEECIFIFARHNFWAFRDAMIFSPNLFRTKFKSIPQVRVNEIMHVITKGILLL